MKFCSQCGKQIDDSAKFCQNCGTKQQSQKTNLEKAIMQNTEANQSTYPVEIRTNLQAMITAICLAGMMAIFIYAMSWVDSFFIIIFIVLEIVFGIGLIAAIGKIKTKVYIISCPYCGEQTIFPVGVQGYDCDICHKRMIMKNNQVQKTSN